MKKIAYIHFSDLHIGQKYANQYLSNAKDIVLQDLDFILKELKALKHRDGFLFRGKRN